MNDLLYQFASFQVLRRPTRWRWSHARHHTDTLVTGRDPEVAAPVPTDLFSMALNVFAIKNGPREMVAVLRNALVLPGTVGAWLYTFFGLTQHAGLLENVTDHRLNCRTVHMNPVFRFLTSATAAPWARRCA